MAFWDDMQGMFGSGQVPGGNPQQPTQGQSNFFSSLLNGALQGVNQAFSTSDIGKGVQATLLQGQSQSTATRLFGNPLILLGVVGILLVVGYTFAKR